MAGVHLNEIESQRASRFADTVRGKDESAINREFQDIVRNNPAHASAILQKAQLDMNGKEPSAWNVATGVPSFEFSEGSDGRPTSITFRESKSLLGTGAHETRFNAEAPQSVDRITGPNPWTNKEDVDGVSSAPGPR